MNTHRPHIHPTAIVRSDVRLGVDVSIGPYTIIDGPAQIGDRSVIGSHCHIGVGSTLAQGVELQIGADSLIRSHNVLYQGSVFGDRLVTGHHVIIREACEAGVNWMVGTGCDVQGHCRIGNYVRMHSHVQVNHLAQIEDFVWLFPFVLLTNDPRPPSDGIQPVRIGRFAALGARALVLPGIHIGEDALIGAGTLVQRDVPDGAICLGTPGRIVGKTEDIKLKESGKDAYPWRRHFHRGYPNDIIAQWKNEFPNG